MGTPEKKDFVEPKYSGSFVGQTQTTNGQGVDKILIFGKEDEETGELLKLAKRVHTIERVTVVWDGARWMRMSTYRAKNNPIKGAKTVEEFLLKGGRIRR